jgi:hypothetical protein
MDPTGKQRRLNAWLFYVLLGVLFLGVTTGLHFYHGEPARQFSDFNDESSHFLTGLLIRDYAVNGIPGNPLRFAKDFYLHYPKVAFGSWPPLFHMLLGAWLLVMPVTRYSALLFVNVTTALFGLSAVWAAQRRFSALTAAGIGLAAVLSPMALLWDNFIQADTLYAVFSVICVYSFATWLTIQSRTSLWCFAITFLAALATKNNAMFLGITLPAMMVLTGSIGLIKKKELWFALLPGALFCAAWQFLTLPFVSKNILHDTTLAEAVKGYFDQTIHLVWIGFLPFILWAIIRRVVMPVMRWQKVEPWDAASFAMVLGTYLFHAALPHSVNGRYLLPSVVALLLFAAEGIADSLALAAVPQLSKGTRMAAIGLVLVLPEAWGALTMASQPGYGYADLAGKIETACPPETCPSILVSASFGGEGMIVAELASREQGAGHWLVRATKILQQRAGENNHQRELVKTDPQEMERRLEELPIHLAIVSNDGDSDPASPHNYLVGIIQANPEAWEKILAGSVGGTCHDAACTVDVYRLKSAVGKKTFSPSKLPSGMALWPGM